MNDVCEMNLGLGGRRGWGVLRISSDGEDRRIFLGSKIWQVFSLCGLDLSWDFWGYSNKSEVSWSLMPRG